MTIDFFSTVVEEIIKYPVEHGLTAAIGVAVGGGGTILAKFLKRNPLGNVDFKIVTESTEVTFRPGTAVGRLLVDVYRDFNLKLKDRSKKGTYQLRAQLKGNNVSGKWNGCEIMLNGTEGVGWRYKDDDDSSIEADPCKISTYDSLQIKLKSTETISRARGFYALIITNPKEKTTIKWEIQDFDETPPRVTAYASSEDFDLTILRCGIKEPIYESSHQVTYFFTWAEELFK